MRPLPLPPLVSRVAMATGNADFGVNGWYLSMLQHKERLGRLGFYGYDLQDQCGAANSFSYRSDEGLPHELRGPNYPNYAMNVGHLSGYAGIAAASHAARGDAFACNPLIKVAFADKNLPFDFANITQGVRPWRPARVHASRREDRHHPRSVILMIVGDIVKYRNTGTVGKIEDVMVEGKVVWALLDTSKLYYDATTLDPASEDEYHGAAERERGHEGPAGGPRPSPPRNGGDGREGLQDNSLWCGLGPSG